MMLELGLVGWHGVDEREEDGITRDFDFDDEVDGAWLCNAGDGDFLSFSESLFVINESAINDDEDEARAEGLGAWHTSWSLCCWCWLLSAEERSVEEGVEVVVVVAVDVDDDDDEDDDIVGVVDDNSDDGYDDDDDNVEDTEEEDEEKNEERDAAISCSKCIVLIIVADWEAFCWTCNPEDGDDDGDDDDDVVVVIVVDEEEG